MFGIPVHAVKNNHYVLDLAGSQSIREVNQYNRSVTPSGPAVLPHCGSGEEVEELNYNNKDLSTEHIRKCSCLRYESNSSGRSTSFHDMIISIYLSFSRRISGFTLKTESSLSGNQKKCRMKSEKYKMWV